MSHFIHKKTGGKRYFYGRLKVFQKNLSEIIAIYNRIKSPYAISFNVSSLGLTIPGGGSHY